MRLKISHVTEYRYEQPTSFSLQRLRLTPQNGRGQTVMNWNVTIEGAKSEVEYDDQFDNRTLLTSKDGAQDVTRIVAEGEIETQDLDGVIGPHTGFCPLWLFQRKTALTAAGPSLNALASGVEGSSDLDKLHALMSTIHESLEYRTGSSGTETTAEEALEERQGVCQDYAHIFIGTARLLNFPARYVSGYLLMNDRTEQTASHAWAEAHIMGLGWVGFDPTNNICPDSRYVRLATGLSYRDAAPVSGLRLGAAGENLAVTLRVEDVDQDHPGQSQMSSEGGQTQT